jgi:hypothetical protein
VMLSVISMFFDHSVWFAAHICFTHMVPSIPAWSLLQLLCNAVRGDLVTMSLQVQQKFCLHQQVAGYMYSRTGSMTAFSHTVLSNVNWIEQIQCFHVSDGVGEILVISYAYFRTSRVFVAFVMRVSFLLL